MKTKAHASGFTLIEVMVTLGLVIILVSVISQSLFQSRSTASLSTTAEQVINDVRGQQLYAMLGATPSAGMFSDYSVRFDQTSYTLFAGDVFDNTDPTNLTISLDGPLTFSSVTFPGNILTFSRLSGDVAGFASGQDSVTLTDIQSGQSRLLRINRRGIFTSGQ